MTTRRGADDSTEVGLPTASDVGPSEPEQPPTPAAQAKEGYADKMLRPYANRGHGHVRPRPDGAKAGCGGPGLCKVCAREQAALQRRELG